MNESEFNHRAQETLLRIEEAIEASGADIDFESGAGMLTLIFRNGSQIIINRHGVARQIWVAAKSGGFHYGYDAARDCWVNENGGSELMPDLSRFVSEQAGEPVSLG